MISAAAASTIATIGQERPQATIGNTANRVEIEAIERLGLSGRPET
ncbi:hypothetical protein [Mesorhizobium sp.]|nr:hypothetical protein [Mesorhizobium sp.]